jgi:RNA polymerase sigma-70 factor, ECF subfamily
VTLFGAPSSPTLASLFRAHADAVWRTAVALGVSRDDAKDVVQDVFVVVHRRLDAFANDRAPRPWILGITRNVVRHHHRGATRRTRSLEALPPPEPLEPPHRDLERREAGELVEAFLATLDEKKRVVFVLGFIEGLPARAIAELLDAPIPTIYARARTAEQAFAKFVERHHHRERRVP